MRNTNFSTFFPSTVRSIRFPACAALWRVLAKNFANQQRRWPLSLAAAFVSRVGIFQNSNLSTMGDERAFSGAFPSAF